MAGEAMSDWINLDNCAVVVSEEPAYVYKGLEDLTTYLQSAANCAPTIIGAPRDAAHFETVIIVGRHALESAAPAYTGLPTALPSEPRSYLLSTHPGRPSVVVAAGYDSHGTQYALVDLIREIRVSEGKAWLPSDLHRLETPHFGLRGMYAHLHWHFDHPYALRTWSLDDWQRYVDLLAQMKLNLFQIWTMAAICPNPLSPEDEDYLCKYQAIVEYAREARGMEVWPGECANNLAESDFGAPIEQREYFQVEVLKNPADRKQFQDVMDNRANMYRLIDNGDGYWIIDSDPGKWKGSPPAELADIFAGNRALMDQHTKKGADTKLVYWMWQGWGNGTNEENWRGAIEGIRDKVHEPWWLTPCNEAHLNLVSEMGYLDRSVFFPYSYIEPEPSNPITHLRFTELAARFDLARNHAGLAGIMGNAQTPFAQLPNIFFFAECAWNPKCAKEPPDEIMRRLGRFMFPAIAEELAQGWLSLTRQGSAQAFGASATLESLLADDELGPAGPGGRFIFPDPALVVWDLALLLRMHGYSEEFRESVDRDALFGYLRAVLEWQARTGWHGCRVDGVDFQGGGSLLHGQDYGVVREALAPYLAGNEAARDTWASDAEEYLKTSGFSPAMSERVVSEVIIGSGGHPAG